MTLDEMRARDAAWEPRCQYPDDALAAALRARYGDHISSATLTGLARQVLAALRSAGWTVTRTHPATGGNVDAPNLGPSPESAVLMRFTVCDVCMSVHWGSAWCHDQQTAQVKDIAALTQPESHP